MAILQQVKRGLCNLLTDASVLFVTRRGSLGQNGRAFSEHERYVVNLMTHETRMFADLKRVREELTSMRSCATTRYILLNTDFGRKEASTSLMQDLGMEMEPKEIEILTRKFMDLSQEEGKLLRMLRMTKQAIKKNLSEESTQWTNDLEFKMKVAQVSHERTIACFQTMREATQYFEFLAHLNKNCDFITRNSSSGEILETLGKELKEKFPFLNERLLKHGMDDYILRLQGLYVAEHTYKFCLFLPSCKFVEHNAKSLDADIELLKQVDEFQRKFSELPDYSIEEGLDIYRQYLEKKCDEDEYKWLSAYEEDLKRRFDCKKNRYLQVSNPFIDSVYEMVLRTRKQGYQMIMDGDPETQVREMVKCFEGCVDILTEKQYSEDGDIYDEYREFDELFIPYR